jgi:hypothetical protein
VKYFSPQILDGSVTTASLADNSVTLAKMANNAIQSSKLDIATDSAAGSIGALSVTNILLNHWTFFPHIHGENATDLRMSGHTVDGGANGTPRFSFYNSSGSARTYDVDWKFLVA